MESQMRKGKGKEPVFEKFAELWARAQPKILARHDALFCADVPLQKREKFYWAKMQAGLKDLLLRVSGKGYFEDILILCHLVNSHI
jgi:hypothetical protein